MKDMVKKAFFYIYYRFVDMHSKGEDPTLGAFLAIITISIILWLNIFSLIALLRKINVNPFFFNKVGSITLGLILIVLDYFILMYNNKNLIILNMFKEESKKTRSLRTLWVLLYIILSIIIFVLIASYKPGKL